jgi:hypothetical protein
MGQDLSSAVPLSHPHPQHGHAHIALHCTPQMYFPINQIHDVSSNASCLALKAQISNSAQSPSVLIDRRELCLHILHAIVIG